jgi:hypothetical protein
MPFGTRTGGARIPRPPTQTTQVPPSPTTPEQEIQWTPEAQYEDVAAPYGETPAPPRPGYDVPPLGFPMPARRLKLIEDIAPPTGYGKMYADEFGFMWREPSYRPRFDVHKAADPALTGGWQSIGTWFRSRQPNPEYEPSAIERIAEGAGDIIKPAAAGIGTLAYIALAGGALYVAAPYLMSLRK